MSSLENNEIDEIKNLYNTFKDELKADIKNNTITKGKDCYLIKKPWDSELYKNIINNYNRNSYTRKSSRFHHDTTNNNTLNLPTNSPEFINDIKTIISCIKDGEELKLQNPKLIDFIDKKKRLIVKKNLLNYLAGNNKILLELPDNKYKTEDEVLLIDNAFSVPEGISKIMRNVYLIKYKVKSFRMRYKKDELYELLLSPTKVEKLNLDSYKNDNSNIQVEIEDIYKENNSSPTNISGNKTKQFDCRRRIRGEKTEDTNSIKEQNSENTREEKLANPSCNNNKYGIRKQMSTINSMNKKVEENNITSKKYNYYSNQIDNSTISTENSRNNNNNYNNKYRGNYRRYRSTEETSNNNEELIPNMKSGNIYNNTNNEKEIQKLNNELNNIRKELNDKVKNYEDIIKKNKGEERNYLLKIKEYETSIKQKEKEFQKKLDNLEKENKRIQTELDKKIKEGYELFDENKILKNQKEEYNEKIKELENKLKNNEKENKNKLINLEREKQKVISEMEINLNKKDKTINKLEKENSEIQIKLNNEIKEKVQLYDENQILKKNEGEYNETIKDLENKIKNSEKEFKKQLDKLEKENNENISQFESELDNKSNDLEKLTKENKKLIEKEKNYLKKINDYELKEKTNQSEKKELQNKIYKSEKDLNELKKINSEISNENDKLLSQIKNYEIKLKEKKDNNDKLAEIKRKEINEKVLFLENKEIEIDKKLQEIEIIKKELTIKRKQLDEEIKNNNKNQKQFNNFNGNNNNFNNNINSNNNGLIPNPNINNMNIHNIFPNMGFNNNNLMNNIPFNMFPIMNNNINNNVIPFNNMNNNNININANNNIIIPPPSPPSPHKTDFKQISTYQKPTLIGLNNIGATCYLNATLQCLSQTAALTNYFLTEKNKEKIINNNIAKKNKKDLQLCPIYLDLIQNLWDKNNINISFSPNQFMSTIEAMNPLFKKGQAGDSKDFIIFILEQMHKELKKPVKNNIQPNEPLNQYNKGNAFKHFFYEFQKDVSIISDIFFGFNETTNVCLNCKNNYNSKNMANPICYNYAIFNVIIFPLEEVKKFKYGDVLKNNFLSKNKYNVVNLNDCFNYNQKTDLFTGDNKNYCNICKQLWDSEYTSKIFSAPNILVLILNRGKNNMYKVKLDFQETIDISNYVITSNGPIIYNLYAVITHLGESGPNAHFVATCKSPVDNIWYRYNDAMVNRINNFFKDVTNFGTPYILFYQKSN